MKSEIANTVKLIFNMTLCLLTLGADLHICVRVSGIDFKIFLRLWLWCMTRKATGLHNCDVFRWLNMRI